QAGCREPRATGPASGREHDEARIWSAHRHPRGHAQHRAGQPRLLYGSAGPQQAGRRVPGNHADVGLVLASLAVMRVGFWVLEEASQHRTETYAHPTPNTQDLTP